MGLCAIELLGNLLKPVSQRTQIPAASMLANFILAGGQHLPNKTSQQAASSKDTKEHPAHNGKFDSPKP